MENRASGILLHITSLPSAFGVGDLGPEAYEFVTFLKNSGQRYWQILPINPIQSYTQYSPYSSSSSFAVNILLISPELLVRDGFLSQNDLKDSPGFSADFVDYDQVHDYKTSLLNLSFKRFRDQLAVDEDYREFKRKEADWLDDFALFQALKESYNGKSWIEWKAEHKLRDEKALNDFKEANDVAIEKIMYFQFIFLKQWKELHQFCRHHGVQIIGDMPIYVNLDSVDVWRNQEIFKLDESKRPQFVAGVPPDYFSSEGQLWGNPVFDWDELQKGKFAWWIKRLEINLRRFDVLRIDHFRGLVQYWEVPSNDITAKNGYWVDVPTEPLLDSFKERFGEALPIIAEDLGTITPDVWEVMNKYNLPGMKVLLFAFHGDLETHPYLPHNHQENCIVYTGTHDNNTIKGWFNEEASEEEKSRLNQYLNRQVSEREVNDVLLSMAFDSRANVTIIPLQDFLNLDQTARMNQPGTCSGSNWRWRVDKKSLTSELSEKVADLTQKSHRS